LRILKRGHKMKAMYISKKGNAVGFTAQGETVIGRFTKSGAWRIAVANPVTENESLTDPRGRNFAIKNDAIEYANTLIDPIVTAEKAWW
jgi:hypothetical protein